MAPCGFLQPSLKEHGTIATLINPGKLIGHLQAVNSDHHQEPRKAAGPPMAPGSCCRERIFLKLQLFPPPPRITWKLLSCFELGEWGARFCASLLTRVLDRWWLLSLSTKHSFLSHQPSRKGLFCLCFVRVFLSFFFL